MKILITGAKGFVGKNLIVELRNQGFEDLMEFDVDSDLRLLDVYAGQCEFVFHLAGVNRPENQADFMAGNFGFTSQLLDALKKYHSKAPVLITSSIQAAQNNPYGESKKAGEDLLFDYSKETGSRVYVYRLPNVFGKWCRPNYNSAVATFCNNIAHNLPIQVNDPNAVLNLVYVDDVINSFIAKLKVESSLAPSPHFEEVSPVHTKSLGEIVTLLNKFKDSRSTLQLPDMGNAFEKKLYSTYLSYLPESDFSYPLKMNVDQRGSFTEFLKTNERGQVSVNISKPHIIKGNHWHHTKNEKFLVVSGKGVIRFRKIDSEDIIEYFVSGERLEVVDIPVGYTHNIENLGETDMVTIMWVNEVFDKERPDTYFLEVTPNL
ncbi:capsular polysaccharide biosynthesis protein CapF [Paludibacter propionicigenes]|nr:capsular polysaccharide biosynthesis protein CapF [Paludibacter propionicigenes]